MEFLSRKDIKWLQMAEYAAKLWSTCAKRQYFSFVLDAYGRVVGTGYNGSPPGIPHCIDGHCPRMQQGSAPGSSYDNCISIHAEENALLWSDRSARAGGTLIVNGMPCWGCGKKIAGSGIARLVYIRDESYADMPRIEALMEAAGVQLVGASLQDLM
jgi:dCMP deaminase